MKLSFIIPGDSPKFCCRGLGTAFFILCFFIVGFPAQAQNSMIFYHNDISRTGLNPHETLLAPSNVNKASFGKLFTQPVDGHVYAQPLYVPGLSLVGGTHNVIFICTEHDSVYAFDADNNQAPLWHTSFLSSGVTSVPYADVASCNDLAPEFGITDTPAIDLSTGTFYVEAETEEVSAGPVTNIVHRLHALDLHTGSEKFGGPVTIGAVWNGAGGPVTFDPSSQINRPGLVLYNGVVYTFWGSHCDDGLYYGWILGYGVSDLMQKNVFVTAPVSQSGSIWQSGIAPAMDASGNFYLGTGNANFDVNTGGVDYGDSILKLSVTSTLSVTDYFTPANQDYLNTNDEELGSVGPILLPDSFGTAAHPHLLTGGDKTGEIYLLDRDNLGGYLKGPGGTTDAVLQEFHGSSASATLFANYTAPACFSGNIYWSFVGDPIRSYSFVNGQYDTTASSQTADIYNFPGCIPSLSSNLGTNGILWAIQPGSPAVLCAYDATNLATKLYDSTQAAGSRDTTGSDNNKFTPPTIINGKVYVPMSSSLVVYGLLIAATPTATPTPSSNPPGGFFPNVVAAPNISRDGEPIKFLFSLKTRAQLWISIYNVAGELIYYGSTGGYAGSNSLVWPLKNQRGEDPASGVYFYVLRVEGVDGKKIGKILVLR